MNRFQGISCLISKEQFLVKNTNFSNQRPYRSVLLHENFQCFGPNHDISISNKGLYEADLSAFCGRSILESTRAPQQTVYLQTFLENPYQT